MSHRYYDASETAALLPYAALRDEVAAVVAEHEAGTLFLKERLILPLPAGTLLAMPAADSRLCITKVVTVHPGNAARGLATIAGEVIVARADDGTRLGLLHGGAVTMRRTAAVSLLAARLMGAEEAAAAGTNPAARRLLVIGAGHQARAHAEAFTDVLTIDSVTVASRTAAKARALVADLRAAGVEADAVEPGSAAFQRAVQLSGIIVTATTSVTPVVTGDVLGGAAIFAVGAFRTDMAELSPSVVAGAARVVVDSLAGARHEAGDLIQAAAAGVWSWDAAVTLPMLMASGPPRAAGGGSTASDVGGGPSGGTGGGPAVTGHPAVPGGHSVFKSVGHAMYDLAAARVAFPDHRD